MKRGLTCMAVLLMAAAPLHDAGGEVWLCSSADGRAVFTTSPARAPGVRCDRDAVSRAAYNKLSPGQPFWSEVRIPPRRPESAPAAPEKAAAEELRSSLEYEERSTKKKGARSLSPIQCLLHGRANGTKAGMAQIEIARGGADRDKLTVFVPAGGRPGAWRLLVPGKCRKPALRIFYLVR